MEWLVENWEELGLIVSGVLSVASVVTKLTPTPKDDELLRQLLAWLSFLQPRGAGILKMPMTPSASPGCGDCSGPDCADCDPDCADCG